jgi:hypothetical protein
MASLVGDGTRASIITQPDEEEKDGSATAKPEKEKELAPVERLKAMALYSCTFAFEFELSEFSIDECGMQTLRCRRTRTSCRSRRERFWTRLENGGRHERKMEWKK